MSKLAHSGNADMDAIERQGRALDEQESRQVHTVKHSPAPWKNGRDANGDPVICQADYSTGFDRNPEYQANRALFDAAPELLDIARLTNEFGEYVEDYAICGGGAMKEKYGDDAGKGFDNLLHRFRKIHRKVDAVIARVEGK